MLVFHIFAYGPSLNAMHAGNLSVENRSTMAQRLGGFNLNQELRASETYHVYLGVNDERQRAAIKVAFDKYPNYKKRCVDLESEYELIKQFDSPSIVKVYTYKQFTNSSALFMEYVNAPNLRSVMKKEPDRIAKQRYTIIRSIGEALLALENANLVHRDIKPENLLLQKDGSIKLIDFSIAMTAKKKIFSFGGNTQGTREYMSPEQIKNKSIDPRSDAYSFGALVYEILAGKPPFTGSSPDDILDKHLKAKPQSLRQHNQSVSQQLDKMIMRLLAKNPDERYPMLSMFLKEFEPTLFV